MNPEQSRICNKGPQWIKLRSHIQLMARRCDKHDVCFCAESNDCGKYFNDCFWQSFDFGVNSFDELTDCRVVKLAYDSTFDIILNDDTSIVHEEAFESGCKRFETNFLLSNEVA